MGLDFFENELLEEIEAAEERGDFELAVRLRSKFYESLDRKEEERKTDAEKWRPENLEEIRMAMLADDNRIEASDFYFDRIMQEANKDPEIARDLANMIREQRGGLVWWPETQEEVDENARILWNYIID